MTRKIRSTCLRQLELFSEEIRPIAELVEQIAARFIDQATKAAPVEPDDVAAELGHAARDDDGIDVAAVGGRHHAADRIIRGIEIDGVGADEDDIGLLAGRERADLVREPGADRTVHRGAFEHLTRRYRARRSRLAVELATGGKRTLDMEGNAH